MVSSPAFLGAKGTAGFRQAPLGRTPKCQGRLSQRSQKSRRREANQLTQRSWTELRALVRRAGRQTRRSPASLPQPRRSGRDPPRCRAGDTETRGELLNGTALVRNLRFRLTLSASRNTPLNDRTSLTKMERKQLQYAKAFCPGWRAGREARGGVRRMRAKGVPASTPPVPRRFS